MDSKLNIQEIDFEKLLKELVKDSNNSLVKRISTLNVKLRNWVVYSQ
jgi:hypothetical protein